MEPRPSRKSHLSQAVSSSDFSASTSEDDDVVENVACQQPQSMQWTLSPYPPRMHVLHPFNGTPKGKSSEAARHCAVHSTERFDAVLHRNYYFAGCGDESVLPRLLGQYWRETSSPVWRDRGRNVRVSGSDATDGTYNSRQIRGRNWSSFPVHSTDK